MGIFSYADWANKFDPSKLGGLQQTYRYDPTWNGSGENSIMSMLPMFVRQSPGALQSLGLTEADLGYVPGRNESDNVIADQWNLSDAAKKALAGLSLDEVSYGTNKYAKALKDSEGNILGMSKPIRSAGGDLLEQLAIAAIAAGTGGILAQGLGFLAPTVNPLVPSTWGGAAASAAPVSFNTTGWTPALTDSAVGTAGYGASSAGVGSLLDAAAVDAMVKAGSLAPEGVAALIPEGATLGGAGALTGGAFSNAVSGTSLWDKAKNLITGKTGIGSLLPDNATDWAKLLTTIGGGYAAYKGAKQPQLQGYGGSINAKVPTQTIEQSRYGPISRVGFAAGGIAGLPRYLNSPHDGMGDGIAASIDGQKSAALSGGEFVIPADVVSHLGNGNSQAGAQQLFAMMDRVRQERTGTRQQGRQIDPLRMMPR